MSLPDFNREDAIAARLVLLERVVKKWAQHKPDCNFEMSRPRDHRPGNPMPCNCGLDADLASAETPEVESKILLVPEMELRIQHLTALLRDTATALAGYSNSLFLAVPED